MPNICFGSFGPARPHGHFLFTVIAHTGLLAYNDIFFPLSRLQANLSTGTFSSTDIAHTG